MTGEGWCHEESVLSHLESLPGHGHVDEKSQCVHGDILDLIVEGFVEKAEDESAICRATGDADFDEFPKYKRDEGEGQGLSSVFHLDRSVDEGGDDQSRAEVCRYVDIIQGADLEIESEEGDDAEKKPEQEEGAHAGGTKFFGVDFGNDTHSKWPIVFKKVYLYFTWKTQLRKKISVRFAVANLTDEILRGWEIDLFLHFTREDIFGAVFAGGRYN